MFLGHQPAHHTLRNAGYDRLIDYFSHQVDLENTWVAEVTAVMDELDCGSGNILVYLKTDG